MSIYYKYSPDGTNVFALSYVDDCVYWYTYKVTGKWFVDALGNRFHLNFFRYAHRLM